VDSLNFEIEALALWHTQETRGCGMGDQVGPEADDDVPWYEAEQQRAMTSWEVIVASMAAVPFLQAIATHLGNRFATAVDERTTKSAERELLSV
jgi:hypothetical protein